MGITRFDPGTRARVSALVIVFLISFAVTLAGTFSSMSPSEAQGIYEEFQEALPHLLSVQAIFQNNLMYALIMFIPVLGPLSAFYVLYSTGRVIAAFAMVSNGENPAFLFILTFFLPHAWIEYTAYALAISQSLWLTLRIAQRRSLKAEVKNTCMSIAACSALLLLGAVIEMKTIQLLG